MGEHNLTSQPSEQESAERKLKAKELYEKYYGNSLVDENGIKKRRRRKKTNKIK